MFKQVDEALKGGYSNTVESYSHANTPAMGENFNETKPRVDIISGKY